MHKIYELKEKLCKELEEYAAKDKLDVSSVSIIDTLAHTIKNLDKILDHEEEVKEYSETRGGRYSYDNGMRMPMYNSYDGGSYSRGRGRNANRDSMGRYSSTGSYGYPRYYGGYSRAEEAVDSMVDDLQDMMHDLPPEKQRSVQEFIQSLGSVH